MSKSRAGQEQSRVEQSRTRATARQKQQDINRVGAGQELDRGWSRAGVGQKLELGWSRARAGLW